MLQLQNESELLEAQMQKEEAELSVSMCEQAIQEERNEELLDVDREIIVDAGQEQGRNICKNIPPNEASLGRAKTKYQFNPNTQAEICAVNSEVPVHSNVNPSAAVYKTTVSNVVPVVEHPEQDNVNQSPQPSWDPTKTSQTSFPNHSQITANYPHVSTVGSPSVNVPPTMQISNNVDASAALVKALKQVVTTPKIEYMCFDGNPIKFPSFIHNFEKCLEKNSSNEESKLQLLIQHCCGKAKEAIESCVILSEEEGYKVAKDTLQESFGKPHIIARAHIKMLIDLPNIKKADGSTLLEFSRHLNSTNRTLKGMGTQYVSDLDHLNTLKDLIRKLPVFLRAKWAEEAGRIYQNGSKPQFADFLQFIKKRAALINNEFGDDLGAVDKEKLKKDKERNVRLRRENSAFLAGIGGKDDGKADGDQVRRSCQMCSGQHGVWQCERFKQLSVPEQINLSVQQIKPCVSNVLVQVIMLECAQRNISGAKYLVVERSIIHCYILLRKRVRKRSRQQMRTTRKAK